MTVGEAIAVGRNKKYWREELKRAQGELNKENIDRDTKSYWKTRIKYCKEKIKNTK